MTTMTLTWSGQTIDLNPDLMWADEFTWSAVEQSVDRTLTGSVVVFQSTKLAGRPITLKAEDDRSGWLKRSVVEDLKAWADVPGVEMVLTIRGQARSVIFRHQDGSVIDAEPVMHWQDADADDFYRVTLRFMEI